jgi:hypothetical protein
MGRRGLRGLFGVVLASCAIAPASTCLPAHGVIESCLRRAHASEPGRPPDSDVLTPQRVRGMLRDFSGVLWRRYGTADERALQTGRRLPSRLVVPVHFHVISAGRVGRLARATVDQQVQTLNAAYGGNTGGADTGVSFRLTRVDYADDAQWFQRPHDFQQQMIGSLATGGPGTLNLFTAGVGSEVLGFSSFPQWYRLRPSVDGVVVDYRSVPGGQFDHFNRGYTAVHEIGHWLGLFHPFEGGCRPPGDGVDDTPYEAVPTQACPSVKDSCPAPGTDPVHNFMDYGFDTCMREFTPGQGLRIRAMWAAYRGGDSGRSRRKASR